MKTRSRCANLLDDDRETETDESSLTISSSKRRKCISNKMVDHIQKYTRNGLSKISDLPHAIKRELETSRDTDQKSGISPHSNSNDTFANDDEKRGGSVRRSTRQRKFTYDNLNQTWLLASSIPEFSSKLESLFDHPQPRGDGGPPSRRAARNRSYELRRLGLATDGLEYEDMYSRVKRKRRKTVHSFYTRRISQDAGSMADTEDTDRRGLSDSDTIDDQSDLEGAVATEFPAGIAVGESQEDTVVHGPSAVHGPKYSLRPKKPITKRFQFPIEPARPRRSAGATIFEATHSRPRESFKSTAHRTHIFRRKRHAIHNSSSSSSSDDERRFEKRKAFSMARARNRCLPLNFVEEDLTKGALRDRIKIGSSLADIDPMAIDKTVTFEHIGGLDKHIQSLKEMVLFPLMYPEVFQRFNIAPPRGVLFYGPPGTGKTLVARALANECCGGGQRVAFFMRKGADCLSKWVGESERQLRLLFDQAYTMRPSIIFFDEIDGLAPVRSTRQDQIHSSIVSTLLALMDGLDNRGEIVVIGATNRPDAIDPALRRPGRFDRELPFALPSFQSREKILNILTGAWVPPLPRQLVSELAARTAGYCGADLKALCSEAGLVALRRRYPQIYRSKQKLLLDVETIQVQPVDFLCALKKMKPSMQRTSVVSARPLPLLLRPLLEAMLQNVLFKISKIFPVFSLAENGTSWPSPVADVNGEDNYLYHEALPRLNNIPKNKMSSEVRSHLSGFSPLVHRPYFLLSGREGQGQGSLAPAALYLMEGVSVHRLDVPALCALSCRSPEEACAQIFHEAQRDLPSVIFLPHIGYWWETLSETVKATFLSLLQDLDPSTPLLLFATSDVSFGQLPPKVQEMFGASADQVFCMRNPTHDERRSFFSALVHEIYKLPPQRLPPDKTAEEEMIPAAPPPASRKLTAEELSRLRQREEATLRELRVFLRDILTKLARDRRFSVFSRPVDPEEVPDYQEVIKNPMDLETMMTKIDRHRYETVAQFLADIDLVCQNALEYNPDRDPSDKLIRHRACALKDAAHAIVLTELDDEFEKICQGIQVARRERGEVSSISLPERPLPMEPSNGTCAAQPVEERGGKENGGLPLSPTRFSKRIRSMGGMEGQSPAPKSFTSPKRTSRYMIWRRRKSPWFGSCRRKLIRRKIKCPKKPKPQPGGCGAAKFVKTSEPLVPPPQRTPEPPPHPSHPAPEERRDGLSGTDSSATTVVSPEPRPASPSMCQSSCDILPKESDCAMNGNGGCPPTRQADPVSAEDQRSADLNSDVLSISIDPMSLDCLVSQIVRFTENYPVERLQQLYSMLQQCVYRHRWRHDKKDLLKELEQSLDSFLHYKPS